MAVKCNVVDDSEEIKQLKRELSAAQKQIESRDTSRQSPHPVTTRRANSLHSDDAEDNVYSLFLALIGSFLTYSSYLAIFI